MSAPWINVALHFEGLSHLTMQWENEDVLVELLHFPGDSDYNVVLWSKNRSTGEVDTSLDLHRGTLASALRSFHQFVQQRLKKGDGRGEPQQGHAHRSADARP